ncbi:hypothetical protein [Antarcticimicrobium sediminis]|uniref:Uncharacterized protein n=1 Tax=Antarcticimicrobium sediminis TaxID=2546227 RepID=A0A4R5EVK7_9RHOB|nr:hypothetical protein [Antarcticimicrobium sediminis]TDE38934.1 hypothetical protein E1B25_07905 [Antarcticimicrobium sediminis]
MRNEFTEESLFKLRGVKSLTFMGFTSFLLLSILVALAVFWASVWLMGNPTKSVQTLTLGFVSPLEFKENSEQVAAFIGLVVGAAISLAGAVVAVYLASIASDLQRQQFELEMMTFLDGEFEKARLALSTRKRALARLQDFVMRRDHVLQAVLERGKGTYRATLNALAQAARDDKLPEEMLITLSELSNAAIMEQESRLASLLRKNAFIEVRESFEKAVCPKVFRMSRNLKEKVSDLNKQIKQPDYPEGYHQVHMQVDDYWGKKSKELLADDYLPLFSDMKAKVTPELIAETYVVGYNLAAYDQGRKFAFAPRDFANREIRHGMGSILSFQEFDYVVLQPKFSLNGSGEKPDVHKRYVAAIGVADLLRLLMSNPKRETIEKTVGDYAGALLPEGAKMSRSLQRFVHNRALQIQSVATELFGYQEILGDRFEIPVVDFEITPKD